MAKIFLILKTNLILLIPFIIIYFFRNPSVANKTKQLLLSFLRVIIKSKKTEVKYNKNEILWITRNLQETNTKLQNSILNDILVAKEKDEFAFSDDTIKHKKEMAELLNKVRVSDK
ncbi:MAG: hypothetical protein V1874_05985 [Spirochaetota bacterium]